MASVSIAQICFGMMRILLALEALISVVVLRSHCKAFVRHIVEWVKVEEGNISGAVLKTGRVVLFATRVDGEGKRRGVSMACEPFNVSPKLEVLTP